MNIVLRKLGFLCNAPTGRVGWHSHMMAPAPILRDTHTIRVFVGGWSSDGISSIWYVDLDRRNPAIVRGYASAPVLTSGCDGCFDENGVFPAHVCPMPDGRLFLYYTGFQLGHKIRHYNFGGLAISVDGGESFRRHSEAPILDRADEGLFVRAGQSVVSDAAGGFHAVYSAGSGWHPCGGALRPVYDVFYQHTPDGITMAARGRRILACDLAREHGLGRPQLIRLGPSHVVFYTRRVIADMRYSWGLAYSSDLQQWTRADALVEALPFGAPGEFDHSMMYFPAYLPTSATGGLVFYAGDSFGRGGLGAVELQLCP
jgi:hypothetical protein